MESVNLRPPPPCLSHLSPRSSPTLRSPVQMVAVVEVSNVELVNKKQSRDAVGGKHVISIADLDPDVDGDGVITQYEKEVHQLFVKADVDGSGSLNVREFYEVLRQVTEMGKAKHQLKKMLILAVFLIILLVGANTALTVAVTIAFKDSYTPRQSIANRVEWMDMARRGVSWRGVESPRPAPEISFGQLRTP